MCNIGLPISSPQFHVSILVSSFFFFPLPHLCPCILHQHWKSLLPARKARWLYSPAANQTAWHARESLASRVTFWPPSSAHLKTFGSTWTSDSILLQCTGACKWLQEFQAEEMMQRKCFNPLAPLMVSERYGNSKFLLKMPIIEDTVHTTVISIIIIKTIFETRLALTNGATCFLSSWG